MAVVKVVGGQLCIKKRQISALTTWRSSNRVEVQGVSQLLKQSGSF